MSRKSSITSLGTPLPYGATPFGNGFNFSLCSSRAQQVWLCFFERSSGTLVEEIHLDPMKNRTGNVWHIFVEGLTGDSYYAYRIEKDGHSTLFLLDPYAEDTSASHIWGQATPRSYRPRGALPSFEAFDWQGVRAPRLRPEELILYEMHVRGFTRDPSSGVEYPGTYLGVIEKIPYLLDLGINAVELLPIQEFNESECGFINPETGKALHNYWGYATVNFFAPMKRYATDSAPGTAIREFKTLVRELHRNGIEVILDVVFNHTGEGDKTGPILSFKGIDNETYYILGSNGDYRNYSGCGNTVNCNHPVVLQYIIDVLRYWVVEMHVDGFRFDLASILTRGTQGEPLVSAPLIEAITHDPLLAEVKMMAEPWDAGGLYHVGRFNGNGRRWSEWNDKFRDTVRSYIKGTPYAKSDFATRVSGSEDLYHRQGPASSINFITVHDGFTLRDLVSYNHKHNEANGEYNKDGNSNNVSWNCGIEGPSERSEVIGLREKQMRNFHLALLVSQGIPLLLMGDEYTHTKYGNNNTWSHDDKLNWFLWDQLDTSSGFWRFYSRLIHFRKRHPVLRGDKFLTNADVEWHGKEPLRPNWADSDPFIAFTLREHTKYEDLYIAFNPQAGEVRVHLPHPRLGMRWSLIVNTANPSPEDFYEEGMAPLLNESSLIMESFSALLLKSRAAGIHA